LKIERMLSHVSPPRPHTAHRAVGRSWGLARGVESKLAVGIGPGRSGMPINTPQHGPVHQIVHWRRAGRLARVDRRRRKVGAELCASHTQGHRSSSSTMRTTRYILNADRYRSRCRDLSQQTPIPQRRDLSRLRPHGTERPTGEGATSRGKRPGGRVGRSDAGEGVRIASPGAPAVAERRRGRVGGRCFPLAYWKSPPGGKFFLHL